MLIELQLGFTHQSLDVASGHLQIPAACAPEGEMASDPPSVRYDPN